MRSERALFALHGLALGLALAAALAWPRVGEPALLVPLGADRMARAFAWADGERAEYLAIDPAGGRVIARIPSNHSLMRALANGIVPVAARTPGCAARSNGRTLQWKN